MTKDPIPENAGAVPVDPSIDKKERRKPAAHPQKAKPFKDRAHLLIGLTMAFLLIMVIAFLFNLHESSNQPRIVYNYKMPDVKDLLATPHVTDLEGGIAEILYDFEAVKDDKEALTRLLRDWEGPNRTDGRSGRAPMKRDAKSGYPLAPLFSRVSFQYDLEIKVTLEPRRACHAWILFHLFSDNEFTGTALTIDARGQAQFKRYRRELGFDEPSGQVGRLNWKPGETVELRIVVEDFPKHMGYRCFAYANDVLVTAGAFSPEWPNDRRYFPSDSPHELVAGLPVAPQSGFFAVASAPEHAILIKRVYFKGMVSQHWREQRANTRRILDEMKAPAGLEAPASEALPLEDDTGATAPEAAEDADADQNAINPESTPE